MIRNPVGYSDLERFVMHLPSSKEKSTRASIRKDTAVAYADARNRAFGPRTGAAQQDSSDFLLRLLDKGEIDTDHLWFTRKQEPVAGDGCILFTCNQVDYCIQSPRLVKRVLAMCQGFEESKPSLVWTGRSVLEQRFSADSPELQNLSQPAVNPFQGEIGSHQHVLLVYGDASETSLCELVGNQWKQSEQVCYTETQIHPALTLRQRSKVFYSTDSMFLLAQFVTPPSAKSSWAGKVELGGVSFCVVAGICHRGTRVSGHYVAYTRDSHSQWWQYDDLRSCPAALRGSPDEPPVLVLLCKEAFC